MPLRLNRLSITLIFMLLALLAAPAATRAQDAVLSLRTVVIDAGHGGHDPGTVYGQTKEKSINLDVALRLGRMIKKEHPEVKVIYTRSTDVFIPLAERGSIANRNHADLFISIHVNSVSGSSKASGTETFIMGTDKSESNMAVCKRENSVVLLEEDYSTTYMGFDPDDPSSWICFNLMQNASMEQSLSMASLVQKNLVKGPVKASRGIKQAPLLVLWRTTMPAVLVEIGFLSNAEDRKQLTSETGREMTAKRIFDAFCEFKQQYDRLPAPADSVDAPSAPDGDAPAVADKPAAGEVFYSVQIFASKKKLSSSAPDFKGEKKTFHVCKNGWYKYCIGKYSSKEEAANALKRYRNKFPGAFVTQVAGE